MPDKKTALVWLRNDLRMTDNPALTAACQSAETVVAVYIHETNATLRAVTGAARWWLNQSLNKLGVRLGAHGIALKVEEGEAAAVLNRALQETGAGAVYWNRRYAPAERAVDTQIKAALRGRGIDVHSHEGNLLAEPWTIATGQGRPYSVFTPFWKALRSRTVALPLSAPVNRMPIASTPNIDGSYKPPKWAEKLARHWKIGEEAAQQRLEEFLDQQIEAYAEGRDFPRKDVTSRLSPHLRFGEISARQIWHAARLRGEMHPELLEEIDKFLSELAWRDFSYHQLYHREDIARVPMQARYKNMLWRTANADLARWQQGRTGLPIIDAGMRELWETGYMHNRVRMLVASLLTKNLLIDWTEGEAWFWVCLVDADGANNPASWQWVAGCGLDPAPYFRIFNPVTQGERFDASGDYVRRWIPELAALPDRWIHNPFDAPADILRASGVTLGETYPEPIVDLKQSRQRALDGYAQAQE